MKVIELRQKRAGLIAEVRKIQEAATGGVLSAEQIGKVESIEKDIAAIEASVAVEERNAKREADLAANPANEIRSRETADDPKAKDETIRAAMRKFLVGGVGSLNEIERRDLQADVAASGGNIVAPQTFVNELLVAINNAVFVRQFATKFTLGQAATLGVPNLSADVADADWTTEVVAPTADTAMQFGKRSLTPTLLTKLVKVAMKLLQVGTLPAEQIVRDRLAYKFGIAQEKGFLLGTGVAQPLGLFTASANGISTGRDVATDNTATAFTADGLINAQMSVKSQYRRLKSTGWILHRDSVKMARKLKDSQNRYLFEASLQAGSPDMLLGSPILESEYAPNTFTTGLYVGLYGALEYYWIVDQIDFVIQRLNELYAGTNQIGFIGRLSTDGQPVLEEAFARVKLA